MFQTVKIFDPSDAPTDVWDDLITLSECQCGVNGSYLRYWTSNDTFPSLQKWIMDQNDGSFSNDEKVLIYHHW